MELQQDNKAMEQGVIVGYLQEPQVERNEGPPFFLNFLNILRRRKWLVLICMAMMILPIILYIKFARPVFEAEASVIYATPKEAMFILDDARRSYYNQTSMTNLTEQLRSRQLAEAVARKLPAWIIQAYELPDPRPADFSLYQFMAEDLQKNLSVEWVRMSDILVIRNQAADAKAASVIANTYVRQIIEWNLQQNRNEITSTKDIVESQLEVFQQKLIEAENALEAFKKDNRMISLTEASSDLLNNMTEMEIAYNQTSTERQALQERKNTVEKKINELFPKRQIVASPAAQQLKQRIVDLGIKASALQTDGAADNPNEVAQLNEEISLLKQELVQELLQTRTRDNLLDPIAQGQNLLQECIDLEVELETYKAREAGLKKILDKYDNEMKQIPGRELQLARLVRAKELNEKIYAMLVEKHEEIRIKEAARVGNLSVVDLAIPPDEPVRPQKKKYLLFGVFLGLTMGVGLAFVLEYMDMSIISQEDVDLYVKLPVLAVIPGIQSEAGNGHSQRLFRKQKKPETADYNGVQLYHIDRRSYAYQAYQILQIRLDLLAKKEKLHSLLITSPGSSEGKTLTAANLALAFALNGTKTILVDCDLRRPMVHHFFAIPQQPGLTDIIEEGRATVKGMVHTGALKTIEQGDNLIVLPSGTNTREDLSRNISGICKILTVLQDACDVLIIDCPPVLPVTDAVILSTKTDGVCLVLRSEKTNRQAAKRARRMLEDVNTRILGIVLDDIDLSRVYNYYKYYYYYSNGTGKKRRFNVHTDSSLHIESET